jgi:hypothetical protein
MITRNYLNLLIVIERRRCRIHCEFVLEPLHQNCRLRESLGVADVVAVCVRERDVGDVVGLDAEALELTLERRVEEPHDGTAGRREPVLMFDDRVGHAGLPQQRAALMLEQITVIREFAWLASIDARCPARLVLRDEASAIEHVHAF